MIDLIREVIHAGDGEVWMSWSIRSADGYEIPLKWEEYPGDTAAVWLHEYTAGEIASMVGAWHLTPDQVRRTIGLLYVSPTRCAADKEAVKKVTEEVTTWFREGIRDLQGNELEGWLWKKAIYSVDETGLMVIPLRNAETNSLC